jgi:hypothetical protein
MADDKCKDDATCIASTVEFLRLQNSVENLASTSRDHCKSAKSLAIAAASAATISVAAALASVAICAASGWWFPPLCFAAVATSLALALTSSLAAGAATQELLFYRSSRRRCRVAKSAMSSAYNQMINDCDKECTPKRQFDCHC